MKRRSARRSTSNKNITGNAEDRRRRRVWLVRTFNPELGPGLAFCALMMDERCEVFVSAETVSVDRIVPGGSYRHENIQPACLPCNVYHGSLLGHARKAAKALVAAVY